MNADGAKMYDTIKQNWDMQGSKKFGRGKKKDEQLAEE
jgi:hypothetical protein